jgi:hypothetical protein
MISGDLALMGLWLDPTADFRVYLLPLILLW